MPAQSHLGLVSYETPELTEPQIEVLEEYRLRDNHLADPTELRITTISRGDEAETMRRQIHRSGMEKLQSNYLDYYQRRFYEIEVSAPIDYIDNRMDNTITVFEVYAIDEVWEEDDAGSSVTETAFEFYVYADRVTERLSLPDDRRRKQPLIQNYPLWVEHTIRLYDPDGWQTESEEIKISNDYFTFDKSYHVSGKTLIIDNRIETHKNTVTVTDSRKYLKDLKAFRDEGQFYLHYSEPGSGFDRQLQSVGRWFAATIDELSAKPSEGAASTR